jgi:hypothetical protein
LANKQRKEPKVTRKSDFSHAREQRAEKHGGTGCLAPATIILGSIGFWAGAGALAIRWLA